MNRLNTKQKLLMEVLLDEIDRRLEDNPDEICATRYEMYKHDNEIEMFLRK